jgi:hypothetical protein
MSKHDITMYGEQELSLHVLNTEYLYRRFQRCDDERDLRILVCEFTYTEEQFAELVSDLEDDLKEREHDLKESLWCTSYPGRDSAPD